MRKTNEQVEQSSDNRCVLKECVCYEKSHVQREHNHHIFRWLLRHHISLGSTNEQRERGQFIGKRGRKKKMKVGET